jgi:hypothetical protein
MTHQAAAVLVGHLPAELVVVLLEGTGGTVGADSGHAETAALLAP